YQSILTAAAAYANAKMQARYDATAPAALETLLAEGAELRTFPQPVLEACFTAANEVLAENSAKSEQFKGIYESWRIFRGEQVAWFGVTELSFDTLMAMLDRAGKL